MEEKSNNTAQNQSLYTRPHRRFNPLTGEWILVSPHRTQRPWQGQTEDKSNDKQPEYDPNCYLCPGNERAGGAVNPQYTDTFVFTNDYAALLPDTPEDKQNENDLFVAESERGICRVVCFSPRHDLTLAKMETADIRRVVDVWAAQYEELGAVEYINSVQIFENRGAMMGASNPHPHGQIWSNETIPNETVKELKNFVNYHEKNKRGLLADYLKSELEKGERVVHENDSFVALVPFWAVYPFETLIVSRRQVGAISDLNDAERDGLADILHQTTANYDKFSTRRFHIRWVFISVRPTATRIPNFICTRIFIRRCSVRRRFANLWSATNFWVRRSATSRPKLPPKCYAT